MKMFRSYFDAIVGIGAATIIVAAGILIALVLVPALGAAQAQHSHDHEASQPQVLGGGDLKKCEAVKKVVSDAHKGFGAQFVEARVFTKAEIAKLQAEAKRVHGEDADEFDTYAIVYIKDAGTEVAIVYAGTGGKLCKFVVVVPGNYVRGKIDSVLKGRRS